MGSEDEMRKTRSEITALEGLYFYRYLSMPVKRQPKTL